MRIRFTQGVLAVLMLTNPCAGAATDAAGWTPEPPYRFRLGDDPEWAKPGFDDSDWRGIEVPGGWMAQGHAAQPYVGWYRVRFPRPESLPDKPALAIGAVRAAYEVYVGGELVGRVGGIGERVFWSQELRTRVFAIPERLLDDQGGVVVAIRVQRIVTDGGVRSLPLAIGDEPALRLACDQQLHGTLAWEAAFLTFYGSTLFFSLILWALGFRDAKHFWFIAVILQIGVGHLMYSNLLDVASGTSYWTVVIGVLVDQGYPFSTLMFLKHTLGVKVPRWLVVVFCAYGVLCLAWWINIHTINYLYWWWVLTAVAVFGPVGWWWCLRATTRGHPDGLPLLIGSVGLFLTFAASLAYAAMVLSHSSELEYRVFQVPPDWYAWLFIHVSMIYTLASGYERTRRQLRKTSQGILQAHEEERRRVARELHDGVGQLLSAVKLRLDLLNQQSADSSSDVARQVQKSVEETDQVFDELRRVASDLRPDALQRRGLGDALSDLAAKVSDQSEVEVSATIDPSVNGVPGADHIYRIVQEGLSNAVRHGKARRVEIGLKRDHELLRVTIEDDGVGFDTARLDHDGVGLGLASMRERAELLGAELRVASKPGDGTRISVEGLPT